MTGFMHEKEFSRKSFVKGGGALVVGFSLAGMAGKANAATIDQLANPDLKNDPNQYSSYGPFDPNQMVSWFSIHADNSVSVKLG